MSKATKAPKAATRAKAAPAGAKATATDLVTDEQLGAAPGGFAELTGERAAGFFAIQAGNCIQGILRDVFETKSKFKKEDGTPNTKKVYKIEVTSATPSKLGPTLYNSSDEELQHELQEAKVGDLVGIDQKGWLKSLDRVLVGQEVWIACRGKQPPSADYPQGAWIFDVRAKPLRPVSALSSDDLPTFERPANATSGTTGAGRCSRLGADFRKPTGPANVLRAASSISGVKPSCSGATISSLTWPPRS